MPTAPNFVLQQRRTSNENTQEVELNMNLNNEIEESIIEEDIQTSHAVGSPASPLINSKTKGKSKMPLLMMKPPKPQKQNSKEGDKSHTPFTMKFDTLNNSFKNAEHHRENTEGNLRIEGGVSNLPSIIAEEVTP